jgi:hypothetical protein
MFAVIGAEDTLKDMGSRMDGVDGLWHVLG